MKICVSIIADDIAEAERQMYQVSAVADLIELRIDRIGRDALTRLLPIKTAPILVTNRLKEEGGWFTGDEAERLAQLKRAVSLGADIVDIELSSVRASIKELKDHIRETGNKTQLLISYHDFKETPPDHVLRHKINAAIHAGADIVKIVTFANRMEDNLQIMNLMAACRSKGANILAFCMGELGRISRIAAPLFGAPFTFASFEKGKESAPGQITIAELKNIFSTLTGLEDNNR